MEELTRAKRPAVVVAHPDDESMWCAGLLLRYPKNWDVICCTIPERDPVRAALFVDACKVLGANPIVLNQIETVHRIKFDSVDLDQYDLIVTHNRDGEYGHPQHKEIHEYLTTKYQGKVLCFGYRPKGSSVKEFVIELTPDECSKKMKALQCYSNIGSSNLPTWTMLLDAFAHKFDLWREPYERFVKSWFLPLAASQLAICKLPVMFS